MADETSRRFGALDRGWRRTRYDRAAWPACLCDVVAPVDVVQDLLPGVGMSDVAHVTTDRRRWVPSAAIGDGD